MGETQRRRRRYLIDGRQGRFLVLVGIYFVAAILVFATIIFGPVILDLRAGAETISQQTRIADQFLVLHGRFWPAALLVFGLLAVHAVFLSHRVVGPLYRFRQIFGSVSEGDLSVRVRLREHDYLTREADLLDEMVASLDHRFRMLGESRHELEETVAKVNEAVEAGDRASLRSRLAELETVLAQMDGVLNEVRTRSNED